MLKFNYILIVAAIFLCSCSQSNFNGLPSLPQKDWLNPASEQTTGKRSPKDEPQFYAPEKTHTFRDLVFLAIQQSPVISSGAINLEVQQIARRDAKWRYLPEMHLLYTISNNITQYNKGKENAGPGYGDTEYQIAFSGYFNNPVATYFSVQAQDELMNVAIVTQRKAIGEYIEKIANTLLLMDLKERSIDILKEQLAIAEKKRTAETLKEAYKQDVFRPASYSEDLLQDLELRLRELQMELTVQRSNLKQLVGLGMEQALRVDTGSVYEVLGTFHPQNMRWQDCWERTDDRYLLRQQVRLEEANVMLAWAQYTPNINIVVNESPPNGQAQAADAKTDNFLHLTFDLPLLDWGHRYRMAEMSRARKRQRQHDEIQRQREYGQRWLQLEQELILAKARAERRQHAVASAARRRETMSIAYSHAAADLAVLADFQQNELNQKLAALEADYQVARTRLSWMHFSAELSTHFLGSAGHEDRK